MGSLGGAPRARKCNKRAQWPAQVVQHSTVDCKGKSWLDVDLHNKDRRCESRA